MKDVLAHHENEDKERALAARLKSTLTLNQTNLNNALHCEGHRYKR